MFKKRTKNEVRDCSEEYVKDRLGASEEIWDALVEGMKEGIVMRNYVEEFFWVDDEEKVVEEIMLGERNLPSIEEEYRRLECMEGWY